MGRTPSPQQKAVYQWVRTGNGNLLLVAVAGAGKTTTILNAATLMTGHVAIAAYNRKIADEITGKLRSANIGSNVRAGTFHSFGLSNWRRQNPKVQIDGDKVAKILTTAKVPEIMLEFVSSLVSIAKQRAVGVLVPASDRSVWHDMVAHYDIDMTLPEDKGLTEGNRDELVEAGIDYATATLRTSLDMDADVIDFDDMILAPLAHDTRIWQNDWLLVDEAQDTNPARRALAKKMLKAGGRAIFVGDPAQAIYGFTGADNNSLDIIRSEFACQELPLTVTYRCPKQVVAMAQNYVNHIQAHESAPEGSVTMIGETDFSKLPAEVFTPDAVMLCRTTAPLVAQAFSLIRRGIGCHVEGKEIGKGLLNLASKWQVETLEKLQEKLAEYVRRETEKFLAKGQEQKAEALSDKVETLNVIINALPEPATIASLKNQIRAMFGDTPDGVAPKSFTLSTVHKSKGREWQTVYLFDRAKLMPSKFARQQWQLAQEWNLVYVAITRSKNQLIEVATGA